MITKTSTYSDPRRLRTVLVAAAVAWMLVSGLPSVAPAQNRTHTVFHEGTDQELHVYRIYGKKPGKTLMLIGGIQGDEPGGFLSADHYADFSLSQGSLIVVPRANFRSIVQQRRKINEDMNRKFAENDTDNYETKIVQVLKTLILESDCLLNLHDGSGFFSETWEGPDRNPQRFGQSIIADSEVHVDQKTGQSLPLGDIARRVCQKINSKIENPDHHFHFNNHRTMEAASPNKEQRKSATFYALTQCGIPAFGVETSKSLPLELKVRHHNLAINAFMNQLDIVPESPGINLSPPEMRYLVVSVNDSLPIAVQNGQSLFVKPGDTVRISHIEANYERGLSADIIGYGTVNDFRKEVTITGPARIVARKDYYPCGTVYLEPGNGGKTRAHGISVSDSPRFSPAALLFKVKINGRASILENYARAALIEGDTFEIVDVITGMGDPSDMVVNFKGFVGDKRNNTGEDRGYVIDTGRDLWKRYSADKKGRRYPVLVTVGESEVGKLWVDLEPPQLNYVVVQQGQGEMVCLKPGGAWAVDSEKALRLVDIFTNVDDNAGISAFLADSSATRTRCALHQPIRLRQAAGHGGGNSPVRYRLDIQRGKVRLGSVFLNAEPSVSAAE